MLPHGADCVTLVDRLGAALATGRARPVELLMSDGGEFDLAPTDGLAPAAVLVAITDRPEPGVILTERAWTLRQHAGQIAFPGGRIDPGDADPAAAAMREAEEELGLDRTRVAVVGEADRYRTITGFEVTPVLGVVPPDLPLRPNPAEVSAWFEMPLAALLDPAGHATGTIEYGGRPRHYYEIVWQGRRIWGATAAMAVNLSRRLAWGA